jgi:hypothetical protein
LNSIGKRHSASSARLSARARKELSRPKALGERYLQRVATLIDVPEVVVDGSGARPTAVHRNLDAY